VTNTAARLTASARDGADRRRRRDVRGRVQSVPGRDTRGVDAQRKGALPSWPTGSLRSSRWQSAIGPLYPSRGV
jgi:hypothetical protein